MSLTLGQMKKQLTEHNIPLPNTNSKKEYEKVYNEHFGTGGGGGSEFSDDELGTDGNAHLDCSQRVNEMTDEEIYKELINLGQAIGPVQCTTREFYKRKLIKVWNRVGTEETSFNMSTNGHGEPECEQSESTQTQSNDDSGSIGLDPNGSNEFSSEDSDVEFVDKANTKNETRSSPVKKPPTPQRSAAYRLSTAGMANTKGIKPAKHDEGLTTSEQWELYVAKEEQRQSKIHKRPTTTTPGVRTQLFASSLEDQQTSAKTKRAESKASEGKNSTITIKFLILMVLLTLGFVYYYFILSQNSAPGSSDEADEIEDAIRAAQGMKID